MAMIWVKATELGFDGMQRRRPDARFQIDEKKFSEKWMKKIKTPANEDDEIEQPVSEQHRDELNKPQEEEHKEKHHELKHGKHDVKKHGRASDKSPI